MRVCDIKIHDEHFNRLGFWRLTGRYFATGLSGIILLIGFMTVIGTFISDLLLLWVDPRIRLEEGAS